MHVKERVLRTILRHYPKVPSHIIHDCCRNMKKGKFSSMQRLRELRKDFVYYEFDRATHRYDFTATPRSYLNTLLDLQMGKG